MSTDPGELWLVVAIIQPFKLNAVTLALRGVEGFRGITVTQCQGFGQEKLDEEGEDLADFTEKIRLDIVVEGRDRADAVANVIARNAHTGNRGDGKIFVLAVARVVRVLTGEEGAAAL